MRRLAFLTAAILVVACNGGAGVSPSTVPTASVPSESSAPSTPTASTFSWRDCPPDPIPFEKLIAVDLACFGGSVILVQGWMGASPPGIPSRAPITPEWLGGIDPTGWSLYATSPDAGCAGQAGCPSVVLHADPANIDVQLEEQGWVELSVHFQDASAGSCRWAEAGGPTESAVSICRAALVVDWISRTSGPATPPCPRDPSTAQAVLDGISDWRRYEFGGYGVVTCYGSQELHLKGWLKPPIYEEPGRPNEPSLEPAWLGLELEVGLAADADSDGVLFLYAAHPEALDLAPGRWVELTGHFDDPLAASCDASRYSDAAQAMAVMDCRARFVVTASRPIPPAPSATAAACEPAAPGSNGLRLLGLAVATVELNVRVAPCPSAARLHVFGITNPLPKGSRVLVLAGPVVAGGYRWYAVGLDAPANEPPVGWVAGGRTADTWLRPAVPECPPASLDAIVGLAPIERFACFGSRALSFTAHQAALPPDAGLGGACVPEPGQPAWLVCDHVNYNLVNADGGALGRGVATLLLHFDPATGVEPLGLAPVGSTGPAYLLRGHFGDAAASSCPVDAAPGSLEYVGPWLACATMFVVEAIEPSP